MSKPPTIVDVARPIGLVCVLTPPLADDAALARALLAGGLPHIRISQATLVPGSEHVGTNEWERAYSASHPAPSRGQLVIRESTGPCREP